MKKILRRILIGFVALLACLVLVVAVFLGWGQWRYQKILNDYREAGEPVSWRDVVPPSPSEEENGFHLLLKIYAFLDEPREDDLSLNDILTKYENEWGELNESQRQVLGKQILQSDQIDKLLGLLEELSSKNIILIPYVLSQEDDLYIEHLRVLVDLGTLTELLLNQQESERAKELFFHSLEIEHRLEHQGTLLYALMDVAIEQKLLDVFQGLWFSGVEFNASEKTLIQKWVLKKQDRDYERILTNERLWNISVLESDLSKIYLPETPSWPVEIGTRAYLKNCLPNTWDAYEEFLENMDLPVSEHEGIVYGILEKLPSWDQFSRILVPSVLYGLGKIERQGVQLQLVELHFQLEQMKQEQGQYPETLISLPKRLRMDPFSGEPLKYSIRGGHPFLYSLGLDGIDDGGVNDRERGGHRDDLSWGVLKKMGNSGARTWRSVTWSSDLGDTKDLPVSGATSLFK